MVAVLMCQENMMNFIIINSSFFNLNQDAVPTARIGQQRALLRMKKKTGIIAVDSPGISGAKHSDFFQANSLLTKYDYEYIFFHIITQKKKIFQIFLKKQKFLLDVCPLHF